MRKSTSFSLLKKSDNHPAPTGEGENEEANAADQIPTITHPGSPPTILDVASVEGLDAIVKTLLHTDEVVFDKMGFQTISWERGVWYNYDHESSHYFCRN